MAAPALRRELSTSAADREAALLAYATEKAKDSEEIPLDEGWAKIKTNGIDVLEAILAGETTERQPFGNKGFVSLYTISYRMCSNAGSMDHSEALYERANKAISQYLLDHVKPALGELADVYILKRFSRDWENHKVMVKWIQQLFRHLDNGYIANSSVATLTSCGLRHFFEIAFDKAKRSVRAALIDAVNNERDGLMVDRALLKAVVDIFPIMGLCSKSTDLKTVAEVLKMEPDLEVYEHDFEDDFLAASGDYYARKSAAWLDAHSTPEYLIEAETALTSEVVRVREYLHKSTEPKLLEVVERELLQKHMTVLLAREGSGCSALLTQDRGEDLNRMFRLFSRIPDNQGLEPMAKIFQDFAKERGRALLEARRGQIELAKSEQRKPSAAEPEMVEGFLTLHDKLTDMVKTLFDGHVLFRKALKEAFQDVVNTDASSEIGNIEMLVAYADRALRGTMKLDEAQLEELLEKLLQLFIYLSDKDLYSELYREALAKRLLLSKSASFEAEKAMIAKMKMQMGAPFTTKLEGMVNDYNVGEDTERKFQTHLETLRKTDAGASVGGAVAQIDFNVQVLTLGFWPTQKKHNLALPREMASCRDVFDGWYKQQHNHRVLQWLFTLGDVLVKGTFGKKSFDLSVSPFQAAALIAFNGVDAGAALPFEEARARIDVDVEVAKRVLHSLACGKYRVLTKTGNPKTINTSDAFSANSAFTSKLRRFGIPMAQLDTESKKRLDNEVLAQRGFTIDACLVRTMKARKRLPHQQLIGEVIHQVQNFKPDSKTIRQRIEGLIEREYLKRDETDPKVYIYMP